MIKTFLNLIYIMSWGTCYSGSNNIHFNFPPIMEDGRNFATWVPACNINDRLQVRSGYVTNYAYRQYLITHADQLIKTNRLVACDDCGPCLGQFNHEPVGNTNKHIYSSFEDREKPFGYETSNLKNLYLSSSALNARQDAPIIKSQYQQLVEDK